jgi:EmrB/QacA subfamily drug resistance transporter
MNPSTQDQSEQAAGEHATSATLMHPQPPGVDYSRKWWVMASVAMGIFLATIDGSIVNVAIPTLVDELGVQLAVVQWVVLAYLLTLTTLLPGAGRLADIRGKKPVYITGFIVFTVGSVLCGLSPNAQWLIAMRVVQAVGASMILALGPAILTEAFPPEERGKALGTAGAAVSIGIIAGPTLGGLILGSASWHWIFLVNLPIGIFGAWMAWRNVPVVKPRGGQSFDIPGAATLFGTLLTFLLALTIGQGRGFTDPAVLALFCLSALLLAAFLYIERRAAQPIVDLTLFRNSTFSTNLATGFLVFLGLAGVTFLLPFYLQEMRGFSVRQSGLLLAATPIALGVISPISGRLSDQYGSRRIVVIGLSLALGGFIGLATLQLETPIPIYILWMLLIGAGIGMFQSPNNSSIMGSAPTERLGIASGLLALTRSLGQTTGIALFTALWAASVAASMGGTLPDGGASQAPTVDQMAGLHVTYIVTALVVASALGLAVWALVRQTKPSHAIPGAVPVAVDLQTAERVADEILLD